MDTDAANQNPILVGLKEWIGATGRLSSGEHYLESAVNLAWMLTSRLLHISSAAMASLGEISTEKTVLFLEPRCSLMAVQRAEVAIRAVHFQFEASASNFFTGGGHSSPMEDGAATMQSRALCAVLGNLLLEIFTMGRSSSMEVGGGRDAIFNRARGLMAVLGIPMSIRRLVCDLLAAINNPCPDTALTTLEDVLGDLTRCKDDPKLFLFDRTCPLTALVDTCLFTKTDRDLFGRDDIISTLMSTKKRISDHVLLGATGQSYNGMDGAFGHETNFHCELISLHGYAGCGKSSLLQRLVRECDKDQWFVVSFKWGERTAPEQVIAKAVDDFFGKWMQPDVDPVMKQAFRQICEGISATINEERLLRNLCETFPNLGKALPPRSSQPNYNREPIDLAIGLATTSRTNAYHVIFKSLLTVGRPVLFAHDDVHWAESIGGIQDFICQYVNIPHVNHGASHPGLMAAISYRSNEIRDNASAMEALELMQQDRSVNPTKIAVDDLGKDHITNILSTKLCLPIRYVRELAGVVHSKTRGNPFFIMEFLKSIIENRMLSFSIEDSRWSWDCDVIEMKMISDGVAELLAARFNQLPQPLIQTVKIASLFGSQVESSTMALVNLGHHVPYNMQDVLHLAVSEGLMEQAGGLFQFTHHFVEQTIYGLIPAANRKVLHKCVGTSLLQSASDTDDPSLHLLACDQINKYCEEDQSLSNDERSLYAGANATAAKFAIAASSFGRARPYIDVGMRLLQSDADHWTTQYSLSLELFELSASLSCMRGDTAALSSCLNQMLPNLRSFEDSVKASELLSKLLASSNKYEDAMTNCISVLTNLGEVIPSDVGLPLVMTELSVIETTLASITLEQVKSLPRMTDKSKLSAMKFLSMLCRYSTIVKPMLVPILSCRMVRMTIEEGYCDESIVGLVVAGYGLYIFNDNIQLGYRVGKVCSELIEESEKKHSLRSRLCKELDCTLRAMVEPQQSLAPLMIDRYNSSMLAGDVESAIMCRTAYCSFLFYTGANLLSLSKTFKDCIKQAQRYQQQNQYLILMINFRMCLHLTGRSEDAVGIKSYEELKQESTGVNLLLWKHFISRMSDHFYNREWIAIMELSERQGPSKFNRILNTGRVWFEGIASLNLARQTNQSKWREIGEGAVQKLSKHAQISRWNYEHRLQMMTAELHYLNGDLVSAEAAYKASIVAAREHKFFHEEAVANELFGVFCIEVGKVDKGVGLLHIAVTKYQEWGAMKKAQEVQQFVDAVDPTSLRKLKIRV